MRRLLQYLLAIATILALVISCAKEEPTPEPTKYTLTVSAGDGGNVSSTGGSYTAGSEITITATPNSEYVFSGWSNGSTENPIKVTVNSNQTLTANFTKRKYALSITIEGEGTVTEEIISSGKDYDSGTVVRLTAVPSDNWQFNGWTGAVESTELSIDLTISEAKSITANFGVIQYALDITIQGEGTVTDEIVGTGKDFDAGTVVRLTAVPDSDNDWEFEGWTGAIESTENPIEVTVSEAKSINAKFMRYFDYLVPSHDWENYYQPRIDYYNIVLDVLGQLNPLTHSNTYYGIADFNNDGYLDINTGIPDYDDIPIDYFFILNNGNSSYYLDDNFPFNQTNEVLSPRKTIVGDFNGDGKPDVFRPAGAHDNLSRPNIVLSTNNGYEHIVIENAPLSQPHTICSGDIDNDGDLDVFVSQGGENDGFLINNGDATFEWKWISEIITDFDKGYVYPDGGYGYYGFGSSEMTDVDKDGFVDLILGGSYRDETYDAGFDGPTILWGTGTGKYSIHSSTTLFKKKELSYDGDRLFSVSHDYAVNDVNGDGINDVVVLSDLSGADLIHFILGKGNRLYEDKTLEWVPNPIIPEEIKNVVWIKFMDIDNNGKLDIVEGEPNIYTYEDEMRESLRWEWNGNGFTKIN